VNPNNPLSIIATRDRKIADLEAKLAAACAEAAYLRQAGETLADVVHGLQIQLAGAWAAGHSRDLAGVAAWLSHALEVGPTEAWRLEYVIKSQE